MNKKLLAAIGFVVLALAFVAYTSSQVQYGPVVFYGQIYGDVAGSTMTLTDQGTWYKIESFVAAGPPGHAVTQDAAGSRMVTQFAGVYQIGFTCSFEGSANSTYEIQAASDGVPVPGVRSVTQTQVGGAVAVSAVGLASLAVGQAVTLQVKCTSGPKRVFTPLSVSLSVVKYGAVL